MDNLQPAMPAGPPEPMRLLLTTIAEGRHEEVPHSLSVRDLFDIVQLASREDKIHTLRAWLQRWIESLALSGVTPETCDLLGFITWEIGHLRIYENVVKHMAKRCAIDEQSNLLHPETGQVLVFEHSARAGIYGGTRELPPSYQTVLLIVHGTDHVLQTRKRGIQRMLIKLASAIQDCFDRPICQQGDRIVCPCTIFGSLTEAYEAAGIDWKVFRKCDYPDYRKSFQDLADSIMAMKYENAAGHDCNPVPKIREMVHEVWDGTAVLLTSEQDDHFWARALISGCKEEEEDSWTDGDSYMSFDSHSATDQGGFTVAPLGQQNAYQR